MFRGLRLFRFVLPSFVAISALLWSLAVALAEGTVSPHRLALVIGNAGYPAGPLPTAANDAGLIAGSLASEGYDVTAARDPKDATLRKLVADFLATAQAAGPDTIVVVYISGYGLQADGENFLVPVDAEISRGIDVAARAIRLSTIEGPLEALPAKARVFIYDLAHEAPFAMAGTPLASGLMPIETAPGSLVAFDNAPGTVTAADLGITGVYARTLSQLLETPGLPAVTLFEQLRLRVAQITDGSSVPWQTGTLDGGIALVGTHAGPAPTPADPAARPIAGLSPDVAFFLTLARDQLDGYDDYLAAFAGEPLAARVHAMAAARRESLIWAASVKANVPAAYWTDMRFYPRGPHLSDARRRLALLHAPLEPPPRFDIWPFGALGQPAPDDLAILAKHPLAFDDPDWIALPPPPEGLIPPPPPDDFDAALPPLPLAGTLPLPMPLHAAPDSGLVREPVVPGLEDLVSRTSQGPGGTRSLETTSAGKLLSRSELQDERHRRTITQRDARGAIVSRIVTTTTGDAVTTIQTGPTGGILTIVVSRTDSIGTHSMTQLDGSNRVIATIDRDKTGVISMVMQGPAAPTRQTFVFVPTPTGPPRIVALTTPHPAAPDATADPAPDPTASPAPPPDLAVEPVPNPPPPPLPATGAAPPSPAGTAPASAVAPTIPAIPVPPVRPAPVRARKAPAPKPPAVHIRKAPAPKPPAVHIRKPPAPRQPAAHTRKPKAAHARSNRAPPHTRRR